MDFKRQNSLVNVNIDTNKYWKQVNNGALIHLNGVLMHRY